MFTLLRITQTQYGWTYSFGRPGEGPGSTVTLDYLTDECRVGWSVGDTFSLTKVS